MNKLTAEQLLLLNQKITADDAGDRQVNFDELKGISDIPYQKDEELFYIYRTAVEKAAKLGSLIAIRKPFAVANRETAVLALLTLLDINGYKTTNYGKDVDELCALLEEGRIESTCKWINSHLPEEGYTNQDRDC